MVPQLVAKLTPATLQLQHAWIIALIGLTCGLRKLETTAALPIDHKFILQIVRKFALGLKL